VSLGRPGQNGGHTNTYINSYQCSECSRSFSCANALSQHRQVHLERNVSCPICGDQRFKSATNAVQHIEGGSCTGCRGAENARNAIYQYALQRTPQLLNQKALTYGGYGGAGYVPDRPYECPDCDRTFQNASQLMQHAGHKHRMDQSRYAIAF